MPSGVAFIKGNTTSKRKLTAVFVTVICPTVLEAVVEDGVAQTCAGRGNLFALFSDAHLSPYVYVRWRRGRAIAYTPNL